MLPYPYEPHSFYYDGISSEQIAKSGIAES